MAARRVAITGIGVVSALGDNLQEFYRSLAEARSGVRRLPDEVTLGSGVQVGALAASDPAARFKGSEAGSLDRVAQFALNAAGEALVASGLAAADPATTDRNRIGVYWGTGMGGAHIIARISGYGNSCDASHMSKPDRDGQVRAMTEALRESGLQPDAIGYINAHGTATIVGDVVECEAIKAGFGDAATRIPVSSTKSMHGHLLGGAGAIEMAAALMPFSEGVIPPTANLEQPDPACAVRHVARKAERGEIPQAVMSNSFAFGGSNVVLIARRA